MTKSLSPSRITESQIGKCQEALGAALRKVNPFSNEGQELIEKHWPELKDRAVEALAGVVNRMLEQMRNIIIRKVLICRSDTTQQELNDAAWWKQHTGTPVFTIMLHDGRNEEEEVIFFRVGRELSPSELAAEYEQRGIKPDPLAQLAVNETDFDFADKHPNLCQWQDENGNWCISSFHYFDGGRIIHFGHILDNERHEGFDRTDRDLFEHWWFAGVRK